jgi:polysaccharide export outer membrane protein
MRKAGKLAASAGLVCSLAGCVESDSFLLDPSVLGRWEQTPTTVPIISRLATVEGPEDEFLEVSDVQPADLLPEVAEYRVGPGDTLAVTLFDFPEVDRQPIPYQVVVDPRGYLNLPDLGQVYVSGLTVQGTQQAIQNAMEAFIANPRAFVQILSPSQQLIYVLGGVQQPNAYIVPRADYRLLHALSAAGGFSEAPDHIYIIRQLPLEESATGGRPTPKPIPMREGETEPTPSGPNLPDLIRDLSRPTEVPTQPPQPSQPSPTPPPSRPLEDLPPAPPPPSPTTPPGGTPPANPPGSPAVFQPQPPDQPPPPAIDLPDSTPRQPAQAPQPPADAGDTTWVYLNGQWVRVQRSPAGGDLTPGEPTPPSGQLVTQRVIRVPVAPLKSGDARYNIVVRPGDVIRVPPPPAGTVYMMGQISRPGAFNMTENFTLMRAIAAAGGLNAVGVPERTDVVRMVGGERQGIVRVNLRAIAEGTQPDIFLKPNDMVNVGSNFWATPLAVIRNGFRMTYGFGFLADRNFGNDIFGVPPGEGFN